MNESADFALKVIVPLFVFFGGVGVTIILQLFAHANSLHAERRNRRLAIIESTYEDLVVWHDRWIDVAIVVRGPSSQLPEYKQRTEALNEVQDPQRLAARLAFFGFPETAGELSGVWNVFSDFTELLSHGGLPNVATLDTLDRRMNEALSAAQGSLLRLHANIEESAGLLARFCDWCDGIRK